uniref:Uncharacterized protein n=1 Tax=Panagrolaimus sp. ES5 TaxID=591445 RepID=A0AC34FEC9_9BILA
MPFTVAVPTSPTLPVPESPDNDVLKFTCRDYDGNTVDHSLTIILPGSKAFLYIDEKSTTFEYQTDTKKLSDKAHAKGYVLYDYGVKSGVFVMHSIPNYGVKNIGTLPKNADTNSQHIMCVSIDEDALHVIGEYIFIIEPALWRPKIPEFVQNHFLKKIKNDEFEDKKESAKPLQFKSFTRTGFTLFVKNTPTQVWDQLIEAYPENFFYVINWKCNINTKKLQQVVRTKAEFENYVEEWDAGLDHAKLAITRGEPPEAIVCVSDLNHAESQAKRAGGMLCVEQQDWLKGFRHHFKYTTKDEKEAEEKKQNRTKPKRNLQ